jgi:PAS domain S-box-containing protein
MASLRRKPPPRRNGTRRRRLLSSPRRLRREPDPGRVLGDLFRQSAAVCLLIDPADGSIADANRAAAEFYGWSREELKAKRITDINVLDPRKVRREMARARARRHWYFQFPHRLASGEVRQVEVYSGPVRVGGRTLLYSIIHDITDRCLAEAVLGLSGEAFPRLFRHSPMWAALVVLPEGRFLEVSEACRQLTGYARDEMVGRTASELGLLARRRDLLAAAAQVSQMGGVANLEVELVDREGRRHRLRLSGQVVPAAGREALVVVASAADASDWARRALARSRRRYRDLVHNFPTGGLFVFDHDLRYTLVGGQGLAAVGLDARRMEGRTIRELFGDDVCRRLEPRYRGALAGRRQEFEMGFGDRVYEVHALPLRGQDGRIEAGMVVTLDITARKQAQESLRRTRDLLEQEVAARTDELSRANELLREDIGKRRQVEKALRESEQMYRNIVETAGEGIWLVDCDGRTAFANRRLADMLGLDLARMEEADLVSLVHPAWRATAEAMRRGLAQGRRLTSELRFRRADGEDLWALVAGAPRWDQRGRYLGFLAMLSDITGRKRDEEVLLEHQRRLRLLSSELALTEERERRRLATILHDRVSQNLFMAKFKLSELAGELAGEPGGPQARGLLHEASDILDQSLREARSLTYELSLPILFEHGLEPALEWLAGHYLEHHGLAVRYRPPGGEEVELGEERKLVLFRAAQELLVNVLKHSGSAEAELSLERAPDGLKLTVADRGRGLPAEGEGRAQGYGLFSIQERLKGLGGSLQLHSRPGRGVRAVVVAPVS